MISANADGMMKSPSKTPLATTRHFTSAEIVCVSSASRTIQTKFERQRVVTQVSRNQRRPEEQCQEEREESLEICPEPEECIVNRDQVLDSRLHDCQGGVVVMQIDENGLQ